MHGQQNVKTVQHVYNLLSSIKPALIVLCFIHQIPFYRHLIIPKATCDVSYIKHVHYV